MKAIYGNLPINQKYTTIKVEYNGIDNFESCENCGKMITTIAVVEGGGKLYRIGTDCAMGLNGCSYTQGWDIRQASKEARRQASYCGKIRKYHKLGLLKIEDDYIVFMGTDGIWTSRIHNVEKWLKLANLKI